MEAQENFTFLFSAGTNDPFEPAGRVEKLLNRGKRGRESRKRGKNRIGRRGEIREEDGKERQRSCGICTCRSGQGLDEPCYRSTSTSIAQQSLSRLLSRARRLSIGVGKKFTRKQVGRKLDARRKTSSGEIEEFSYSSRIFRLLIFRFSSYTYSCPSRPSRSPKDRQASPRSRNPLAERFTSRNFPTMENSREKGKRENLERSSLDFRDRVPWSRIVTRETENPPVKTLVDVAGADGRSKRSNV